MYAFFERLIDPLQPRPAVRPPVITFEFFRHFVQPVRGVILATLLFAGIAAVSELYLYIYLGRLVDWMSVSGAAGREQFLDEHGIALLWMLVVVGLIRPVALLVSRALINLAIAPGLANSTRWQTHRYVLRQSMSFFQNDFAGRISQKVWQTGHSLREAVTNVLDGAFLLLVYLIGIGAFFIEINTVLLWPVGLWSLAYLAVVRYLVPPVRVKSARLSESNSVLTGQIVDTYTNIQSVKLFASQEDEETRVAEGIRRQTGAFHALMRAVLDMTVVLTILNTLLILSVAGLSIVLWQSNAITVGEIAVANGLIIRLNQMSGWILRTITSLFEHVGTVQNGIETLSQPLDIRDRPDAGELKVSAGQIEFDRVSFHYEEPSEGSVIEQLSLTVAAGEKVGLVGRSGAGKSTLVNLLMRFHDVDDGSIRIDGQDIREVTQASLRGSIAVVSQDTSLLHRSIRDNIRYGRSRASESEVLEAAFGAEAMEFIPELTDRQGRQGLDAHVGERGVKLSGGQRQRIAIARVILKNAPILVLDEATSALDSEIEAAIQQQMLTLMAGKTVLAVAHRLSTIAALDRLIVLDQGRIVETGSHAELVARGGLYARLWERQSGGFIGI